MAQHSKPQHTDTAAGLVYALMAYGLWGFLPLYMKLLSHISPAEIVAHRVIWSIPIAAVVLMVTRRARDLATALRSPRTLALAGLTAGLVAVNWSVYVWAITSGRALDASLGYYINPIFSVLLGAVILREKLDGLQKLSVAIAAVAVAILTVASGTVPIAALALTVSWGFYALLKRSLAIGPNQGFMLEVLILSPLALGYVVWLGVQGTGQFVGNVSDTFLLLGCGAVTAVPLIFYANGAKGLRLTTIAMLQYIAPTMIFLIAVFVFGEPFGTARMIAFPLIWLSLAVFSFSLLKSRREKRST
jgi:chloramphenicol-sensitive protein RarD